jgi:hypothetical protein
VKRPKERSLARMSRAGTTKAVLVIRPPTEVPLFPRCGRGCAPALVA